MCNSSIGLSGYNDCGISGKYSINRVNCDNCGAPLKGNLCEHCGTNYGGMSGDIHIPYVPINLDKNSKNDVGEPYTDWFMTISVLLMIGVFLLFVVSAFV